MKLLASLVVLAAATIGTAGATVITYSTSGSSFTTIGGVAQGPGVTSFTTNSSPAGSSATLSFGPIVTGTFDDTTLTGISYGQFTDTFVGPNVPITIPSFTFTLIYTVGAVNRTVIGTYGGGQTISQNNSGVLVSYAPVAFTLGSDSYTVQSPTIIVPSTTNLGVSSIQGTAVGINTPEPSTMFLLGAGLIGVGFTARKKFARRS